MSRYSKYTRSFSRLPDFFTRPEPYFESVCRALKKTGAKVLLPCHEDIGIFSRYREALPAGIVAPLPPFPLYDRIEDKWGCIQLAREHGCPVPKTSLVASLADLERYKNSSEWPLVLKTRAGNGAKGVRVARDYDALRSEFAALVEANRLPPDRWPIIQEFLPGGVMGVGVIYHRGRCIAASADRYLRFKDSGLTGTSTFREIPDRFDLVDVALAFMDKIGWHGMAQLEFIPDREGVPRLNEINARPWGSMALAIQGGVDFPYLWYRSALDDPPPSTVRPDRSARCRWLVGEAIAFAQLLRRRRLSEALSVLRPSRRCGHDDFHLQDPLPLVFECFDYFAKMIKEGGVFNPITQGQIR